MYYYAQINNLGICFSVLETFAEIIDNDMIPIPAYDESYLGKQWTGTSWEDAPQPIIDN